MRISDWSSDVCSSDLDHVVLSFDSCAACPTGDEGLPAYCHEFLGKNFAGVRLEDGSSPLSQAGAVIHGNFFGQSSFGTYAIAHRRNTVKVDKNLPLDILGPLRSEERRVGKECVSTCRSRWSPYR